AAGWVEVAEIPEDGGTVRTAGGQSAPVGSKGERPHGSGMGEGGAETAWSVEVADVPKDDGGIVTGGGQRVAVGREDDRPHIVAVPAERAPPPPRLSR